MSVKVKFISEVEVKDGKKVLKAAKNANIKINNSCDGKGKCGKCVIKVLSGKLSEPTKQELKVLGPEKIDKGYRLSCQTQILDDSVIEIINDNEIKVKEEEIGNKLEIKDNNKVKVKKDNVENEIKSKEDNKILVKKNRKSAK